MRVLYSIILAVLLTQALYAAPVIDSVASIASICSSRDGRLTVYAHGAGTLSYAITAGPITHAAQSSDAFGALAAGTYTIQVTDGTGAVSTITQTVGSGTYVPLSISPYVVYPRCRSLSDYIIVGHADPGTGVGPLLWQITSPYTTAYQGSDTFHVLQTGSYTISCADACGSIYTTQVSFTFDNVPNITPGIITMGLLGCDSVVVGMSTRVEDQRDIVFPITLSLHTGHSGATQSYTQTQPVLNTTVHNGTTSFWAGSDSILVSYDVAHTRGDTVYTMMTDGCGDTVRDMVTIPVLDTTIRNSGWTTSTIARCQYGNTTDIYYTLSKPNTWSIVSGQTHAVVASGTQLPDAGHSTSDTITLSNLPGGVTYILTAIDICGDTVRGTIAWPDPAPQRHIVRTGTSMSCLDSTYSQLFCYTDFSSGVTLTMLSGPSGAHSSKPGYEYTQHYTYPRSFAGPAIAGCIDIRDLAPGDYTYSVSDSCGHTINDFFTVFPFLVENYYHSVSYQHGCSNDNMITCQYTDSGGFTGKTMSIRISVRDAATGTLVYDTLDDDPWNALIHVRHVPAGTYIVSADYQIWFTNYSPYGSYSLADVPLCNEVIDTIVIAPYMAPRIAALTGYSCSGALTITAQADSSTGVPPYMYAITSGPQTAPAQSASSFPVSQYGIYTLQITDACGDSSILSITIDSLSSQPRRTYSRYDSCFRATVGGQSFTSDTMLVQLIQSVAGCDSVIHTDSIFIRGKNDISPLSQASDTFCNIRPGTITAVPGFASYLWDDGSTADTIQVTHAGVYTLIATDTEGCQLSASSLVLYVDSPYVTNWVTDAAVCPEDPLLLHLSVNEPNSHFIWADASQYGLERSIGDSGVYVFTVSNQCAASTYILFAAGKQCVEDFYIPNAFTPNGDGINDILQIYTSYKLKLTRLKIFNRWGEMVYEGDDQAQGWDGSYKGEKAMPGTYVYEADLVWPNDRTSHSKGSITLVK